ncbi:hypothetical protein, partial [Fructilactobacillus frigidiflavus]|uniref:hypothetical protein n=1 Tax=Fructilactobacillus frigidiflavus TaxID=3242688 RepID=UPI0037573483
SKASSLKEIRDAIKTKAVADWSLEDTIKARMNGNETKIRINRKIPKSLDKLKEFAQDSINSGWFNPTDPKLTPFVHEFGHEVAHKVFMNELDKNGGIFDLVKDDQQRKEYFYNSFYDSVIEDMGAIPNKSMGGKMKQIQDLGFVSDYGKTSPEELFAEQFSNAYTNSKSDGLNKTFKKVLDSYLKGVK